MFFWHIDFTNHDFHLGTFYTGHTQLIIHNLLLTGTVQHIFLVRAFHGVEGSHVFKKLKELSVQNLFISKLICRSRKHESCGHDMDKTRAAHISLNTSSTKLVLDMTKWLKPFCSCNWMLMQTRLIVCLLMLLVSSGHQQPCDWPPRISITTCGVSVSRNYLKRKCTFIFFIKEMQYVSDQSVWSMRYRVRAKITL